MVKQFYLLVLTCFFGASSIIAQETVFSVKTNVNNQANIEVNIFNHPGFIGNYSCQCVSYFENSLKLCLLRLSDKEFNEEMKSYHDKRIKGMWSTLSKEEKMRFLTAADEAIYQRLAPLESDLPKTKSEFSKKS